jgi:hypothetical protein
LKNLDQVGSPTEKAHTPRSPPRQTAWRAGRAPLASHERGRLVHESEEAMHSALTVPSPPA